MPELQPVVNEYLLDNDWSASWDDDGQMAHLQRMGPGGSYPWFIIVNEESEMIIVISHFPLEIPADRRAAVGELVHRANYGLALGCFELDVDTGDLRHRTAVAVGGDVLTFALLDHIVVANLAMMDVFMPRIADVMTGAATPAGASARAEEELASQPDDT